MFARVARFGWVAPAAWTIYFLLPVPGWGLLDGFPLTIAETAAIAVIWLVHIGWRPAWHASLPVALVVAKLAIGSFAFADRGLVGSYFANDTLSQPAARQALDRSLDFGPEAPHALPLSFLADERRSFSVSWSGFRWVPRDETLTVFAHGRDIAASVAIDGLEVVSLRPGSTDSRAPVVFRAGWRQLTVTLSSSGRGRTFYSGVIDQSGAEHPFGDSDVYRRRVTSRRIGVDRAIRGITWALDLSALAYLAVGLGLGLARHDLMNRDGVTLGLIGLGVVVLSVAVPHEIVGDARVRFDALSGLLEHGRVPTVAYSLVGPLFSAPLFYLGKVAFGPEWWCARYNVVLLAIGLAALDWLLGTDVDRRLRWTFLLVVVAASMFPKHVRGYDAEMFTAVCAAIGIAAVASDRLWLGWTLLVIGAVNTPAALAGLLLVAAWHSWTTKRARHLLSIALAALLVMLESWVRRGGPFVTGYEGNGGIPSVLPYAGLPGFSYPLLFGLLSILLSFGKGLLFYAPGLLVPIRRAENMVSDRLGAAYRMWLIFLAGLLLAYAKWWAWYGGWTWGPRFFLFASVPASLAIAVKLRQLPRLRATWLIGLSAVVALSVWVAIDGTVFEQSNMTACLQNDYAQEFLCWYAPEFSALWRPFVAPTAISARDLGFAVYALTACAWLSAPLFEGFAAAGRAVDVAGVRTAIKSIRF